VLEATRIVIQASQDAGGDVGRELDLEGFAEQKD
jgi:hypothetical protein